MMSKCRECGCPVTPSDNWTAEQLQVCDDCWWNKLDGEERKKIAQEANEDTKQKGQSQAIGRVSSKPEQVNSSEVE